jgi:hypothetical protein
MIKLVTFLQNLFSELQKYTHHGELMGAGKYLFSLKLNPFKIKKKNNNNYGRLN